MQADEKAAASGGPANEKHVRSLWATFRNILAVVCLIFIFAVVQMFTLWAVCNTGMETSNSLKLQGLPLLYHLAALQENLAFYRLDSYEYVFARDEEKAGRAQAVEAVAAQTRTELKRIQALLPDSADGQLASRLEAAVDDLDAEFQKLRKLEDTDFAAAMKDMDQDIPPRTERVAAAANALRDYGQHFSKTQANATFGSFGLIKRNAIMFGAGNILVAFGAVVFILLAARRSRAQLADALARLEERTQEVEKTHAQLVVASRQAGMAEVATSVLHNVGNVLNSVNVSATLIADHVRHSKTVYVVKLAGLFDQHKADLTGFLTRDPRGQMIPAYLGTLAESLAGEQKTLTTELGHLCKNIDHIKDIVAMQQSHAGTSGVIEAISIADVLEDALRINAGSLARHDVDIFRDYQARPVISTDKHKVMQILINVVRNAKYACDESGRTDKQIIIRTTSDEHSVKIAIIDNGVGIPAENLTRIFNHGFTTREHGHGFGLHSSALTARELGGSLHVQSGGPGQGATFVLELPYKPAPPAHDHPAR